MLKTIETCLQELKEFEDSFELAQRLREIAICDTPDNAYFLKEAAINLEQMFDLCRSIIGRLVQQNAQESEKQNISYSNNKQENNDLLNVEDTLNYIQMKRTFWFRQVSSGLAPKPIKIGKRSFWKQSEVDLWLSNHGRK